MQQLQIPDDIYQWAQKIAAQSGKDVEQVLTFWLRMAMSPQLPSEEERELEALHLLSDDALWTIYKAGMTDEMQTEMQELMDKSSLGTITESEREQLERLVNYSNRMMLRRSEAMRILTVRGFDVAKSLES